MPAVAPNGAISSHIIARIAFHFFSSASGAIRDHHLRGSRRRQSTWIRFSLSRPVTWACAMGRFSAGAQCYSPLNGAAHQRRCKLKHRRRESGWVGFRPWRTRGFTLLFQAYVIKGGGPCLRRRQLRNAALLICRSRSEADLEYLVPAPVSKCSMRI